MRRRAVERRLWSLAGWGLVLAFLTLEASIAGTILLLRESEKWNLLRYAWLFGPAVASPVLLIAGPLSGVSLVLLHPQRSVARG